MSTHDSHHTTHTARYVPARTNEGWSVVALVTGLTIALIVAVTVIYQRTYKHPTDPTWHAVGGSHSAGSSAAAAPAAH